METLRCRAYSRATVKDQTLEVEDMEERLRNQQQQVTAVKMENTRYASIEPNYAEGNLFKLNIYSLHQLIMNS